MNFFHSLFGDAIGAGREICVFTLPSRTAKHFRSAEEAYRYAVTVTNENVYFGVGLAAQNFGRRNTAQDIAAIGGLWVDIDAGDDTRSGPANYDDAQKLFDRLPHYPSIVVNSGRGWHAYWVFKEPWVFADEQERLHAGCLARGWVSYVATVAQHVFGWHIDRVGDLARVMRVPGTWNHKHAPPVIAKIQEENGRRYDATDFEDFCVSTKNEESSIAIDKIVADGGLILQSNAEPPPEKFAQLLTKSAQFLATWERKRTDLTDQSQSAYDIALANIAALHQWTRQEIADLIIAARRKHQQKPEKALRIGYVARTIAEAERMALERMRALADIDLSGIIGHKLPETTEVVERQEVIKNTAEKNDGHKLPEDIEEARRCGSPIKTLAQLLSEKRELREPVIYGLLRRGETMNIIANSKLGKSWLVTDLVLAMASQRDWLWWPTSGGNVLLIDNELHEETIAYRIPQVAEARGIDTAAVKTSIHVASLRGKLQDIFFLRTLLREYAPGFFKLIVLDSFYRFFPAKIDENDNAAIAGIYNFLDCVANEMECSFAVIHHASKGGQAHKDITDVGAGAGAMARAVDTHLILRRHREDGAVVVDAAVRSWPPIVPRCMRWQFPVWVAADDLDPNDLFLPNMRRASQHSTSGQDVCAWTPADFVGRFVGEQPKSFLRICDEAGREGISARRAERLLLLAEEEGRVFRSYVGRHRLLSFSTRAQREPDTQDDRDNDSKRAAVTALLSSEPMLPTAEVAQRCGVSQRYVRQIRAAMGAGK